MTDADKQIRETVTTTTTTTTTTVKVTETECVQKVEETTEEMKEDASQSLENKTPENDTNSVDGQNNANNSEIQEQDTTEPKPKVVSLQTILPNAKPKTLDILQNKVVTVVNKDGNKVTLTLREGQIVEKKVEPATVVTTSTTSSTENTTSGTTGKNRKLM